ncbi:MAG: hypothetical protein SGJ20_17305 [Planctomycetota bacterium]|nr:hypothetical protein [Planctomycetota bacterium]
MHLIQILLPLSDQAGEHFPREEYARVEQLLVERFGGYTAYARAPASGLWTNDKSAVERDDLVIYEVMTKKLEKTWWGEFRKTAEQRFRQTEVVIRSLVIEIL